jgi:Ca-activated chloride channel family protein
VDFAHPEFLGIRLWMLVFGLLLAGLALQQYLALRRHLSAALAQRFGAGFSLWRALLKVGLWTAAAFFLCTALATPLGAPIKVEGQSSGADVILAVDVSSSMYAQDVSPNRILAVKAAFSNLISRLGGDRVGIIAFAGEAVIACPLTTDYDTATLFLNKLETDSVPHDGTGFAQAIKLCLDGFATDSKRGRIIIMATDGEDTLDEDSSAEASRAGSMNTPIFTMGVGTMAGAYIPGRPDIFGRVMAKTYQGQPIRVRINPETLKKIASLSGGQYFDGASQGAMNAAYERIRSLKQGSAKSLDRYVRDPLYQEPLLIAVILLLFEMMLSNRAGGLGQAWTRCSGKARTLWLRRLAALILVFLPLGLGAFSLDPGRSEYDQGNESYRQGDYDKASQAYDQSVQAQPERMQSHYNWGNAKYMQQDYQGAIKEYQEALKLDPKDDDAQHNLDLAQKKLEEQKKDGKKDKKDQKDKKDGDKGKQGGQQNSGQGKNQQGQNGQGQQGQKSQGQQGGQGQGRSTQNDLSQDQIRAMMNMLKSDQQRYNQAFQPTKKYQNQQQDQGQDFIEQQFEMMTGQKLHRPQQLQNGPERKDW